jgi:hypothetical protein
MKRFLDTEKPERKMGQFPALSAYPRGRQFFIRLKLAKTYKVNYRKGAEHHKEATSHEHAFCEEKT